MFFRKKDKDPARLDKLSRAEKETLARKLRDDGNRAIEKGKDEDALEIYRQLLRLEPKEPEHRRRLADCYRKLDKPQEELKARCLAATLYAESGFLLKGIAMCKMALDLDPEHRETQKKLAELNALTGGGPQFAPPAPAPAQKDKAAEEARKDAALLEAKARVERVQAERKAAAAAKAAAAKSAAQRAAAQRQAREAEEAAAAAVVKAAPVEAPVPSIRAGAPLESVQLASVIPQAPVPSVPASLAPMSISEDELIAESAVPESIAPESDDDIFIAPLDLSDPVEVSPEGASQEADQAPNSEVADALRRVPLLSDLGEKTFIELVNRLSFLQLAEDDVVFQAGDLADAMYCVVEGEVVASLPAHHGHVVELARLGDGEFFGEIGLLAEQPRQATITATKPTIVLVFERQIVSALEETEPEFIRILLRFVRERLVASLIKTNPLFAPFEGAEADDLTRRFQFLEVKPRKPLIRQGEPSDGVFILLTGGARVVFSDEGEAKELSELGPGDIFGEMSLMNRQDAIASVITTQKSYVLQLPAKDFTQLVMMHPALLAYISSLASDREAENEKLLSGDSDYREDAISLV